MSDSSSEVTLMDFGGEYRVGWEAAPRPPTPLLAPLQRTTMRLVRPVVPSVAPPPAQGFWCKLDPRLVMLSEPDSARAAGFRLLRDSLLARGLPRVLAISSPATGDGKTTCAANLGFALAEQTSAKLLLLDANFFAPALASMFSIDEYAQPAPAYERPWSSPFKLTALTPRLHLATIVLTPGEPLPRVDHEAFVRLLGSFFRAGYDRIILDAPALDRSPVVGRLLDVAEGVVLAVRAGHTTERALRRAVDQVGPSKMMGAALMDSRLDSA